jgi:hypothetical protein
MYISFRYLRYIEQGDSDIMAKLLCYQGINSLKTMLIETSTLIRKLDEHNSFPFTPVPLLRRLESVIKILKHISET